MNGDESLTSYRLISTVPVQGSRHGLYCSMEQLYIELVCEYSLGTRTRRQIQPRDEATRQPILNRSHRDHCTRSYRRVYGWNSEFPRTKTTMF
jgi:hypothetical protein